MIKRFLLLLMLMVTLNSKAISYSFDFNPEPNITNYVVYFGTNKTQVLQVTNITKFIWYFQSANLGYTNRMSMTGVPSGVYITAAAVNSYGLEGEKAAPWFWVGDTNVIKISLDRNLKLGFPVVSNAWYDVLIKTNLNQTNWQSFALIQSTSNGICRLTIPKSTPDAFLEIRTN